MTPENSVSGGLWRRARTSRHNAPPGVRCNDTDGAFGRKSVAQFPECHEKCPYDKTGCQGRRQSREEGCRTQGDVGGELYIADCNENGT